MSDIKPTAEAETESVTVFQLGVGAGCAVAEQTTGERGQSFQEEQRGACRGANLFVNVSFDST